MGPVDHALSDGLAGTCSIPLDYFVNGATTQAQAPSDTADPFTSV
jgi:hypothetical protein